MNFEEKLKSFGLVRSEIKVYLYLLEQGVSTPAEVARGTNIARTNCYHLLKSLKEKELIVEQEQGKRKVYFASDPESLIRELDKRKTDIASVVPDLRALYTTQRNKPKIQFYDGWEQVKEIYLQTLTAQKIVAVGSTKRFSELDPKFFKNFLDNIEQRGIVLYDILSQSSAEQSLSGIKQALKGLHEAKILPSKHGDVPTDILIWDDHVALITLEDPIFGSVLTNKLLAQTFKTMFSVMWDSLL